MDSGRSEMGEELLYKVVVKFDEENNATVNVEETRPRDEVRWFVPDMACYSLASREYVGWYTAEGEEEARWRALVLCSKDAAKKREDWDVKLWSLRGLREELVKDMGDRWPEGIRWSVRLGDVGKRNEGEKL